MAAPPCKGVKKDGTPCRGNGNDQLDGYCIAHGAPEKTRAWRVLGGENSSTAARADKRIPERFRPVIQAVTNGIAEVREGTLKPAAYAAICRGAKILLELYRAADAEMELVRLEESKPPPPKSAAPTATSRFLTPPPNSPSNRSATGSNLWPNRVSCPSHQRRRRQTAKPSPPPSPFSPSPAAAASATSNKPAPPRTTSNSSKTMSIATSIASTHCATCSKTSLQCEPTCKRPRPNWTTA